MFKKRLSNNRHRAIILAKGDQYWVYAYLFAKQDRRNIDDDELAAFKQLAGVYGRQTPAQIAIAIRNGDLLEICHDR